MTIIHAISKNVPCKLTSNCRQETLVQPYDLAYGALNHLHVTHASHSGYHTLTHPRTHARTHARAHTHTIMIIHNTHSHLLDYFCLNIVSHGQTAFFLLCVGGKKGLVTLP